jgi:CheY-like chemotaxis protein
MEGMTSGVLVVDDDAVFRELAQRIVRGAGLSVAGEAATVAAALAAVGDLSPSAVLLDVGLPDGDGLTLAAHLATLSRPPSVVLTSSDPDLVNEEDVRRCGARAFIAKADLPGANLRVLLAGG